MSEPAPADRARRGGAGGGPRDGAVGDRRRGVLGEAVAGLALVCDGFRLLGRERRLWLLSLVPVAFTTIALGGAVAVVYTHAASIHTAIADLLPVLEAGAWYTWLWIGPARLLLWLVGWLAFFVVGALAAVLALVLANVAASPFLDALARRVERLVTGRVVESSESGAGALLRDVLRSIGGEIRRLSFFLAIWAVLFAAGIVIPGAHVVTGPLMVAITILFLPLEFSGYTLDRRQVPFAARRRWITRNGPRMTGFGAAAFAACFVPGVNLLMLPTLVVAGTLLVIGQPPDSTGESVSSRPA